MLTAEQTEAFSRDGFVAGPVVLSAAEVDELREEIGLDLPSTFRGHPVEISLRPVKKGQVHYHHALTWHASHGNHSDGPRRAIAVHYMTGATRHVAAGRDHPMRRYITVADGELLTGDAFPLVYDGRCHSELAG